MRPYLRPGVLCIPLLGSTLRVSHSLIHEGRRVPSFLGTGRGRETGGDTARKKIVLPIAVLRHSTQLSTAATMDTPQHDSEPISVLALHGSEGSAETIVRSLETWSALLPLSVSAVNAPHPKGGGFCWWNMPQYVRSFNATEYSGFEQSSALALDELSTSAPDLVVGHSQGAILVSALLALQAISKHPRLGYILNGVAWPNPYTSQLESLPSRALSSVRVFILVGENDTINPPNQAMRVASALERAGADVAVVKHLGGHKIPAPQQYPEAMEQLRSWVQSGQSGGRQRCEAAIAPNDCRQVQEKF
jgi:predicted esterase